jgi:hypothetical protein
MDDVSCDIDVKASRDSVRFKLGSASKNLLAEDAHPARDGYTPKAVPVLISAINSSGKMYAEYRHESSSNPLRQM